MNDSTFKLIIICMMCFIFGGIVFYRIGFNKGATEFIQSMLIAERYGIPDGVDKEDENGGE